MFSISKSYLSFISSSSSSSFSSFLPPLLPLLLLILLLLHLHQTKKTQFLIYCQNHSRFRDCCESGVVYCVLCIVYTAKAFDQILIFVVISPPGSPIIAYQYLFVLYTTISSFSRPLGCLQNLSSWMIHDHTCLIGRHP